MRITGNILDIQNMVKNLRNRNSNCLNTGLIRINQTKKHFYVITR